MKLNNKGFAISTILYMILILAIILITLTLTLFSSRKMILDKEKDKVQQSIYNSELSYDEVVKILEAEAQRYADANGITEGIININDINTSIDSKVLVKYELENATFKFVGSLFSNYQELDYIESTGVQYINTNSYVYSGYKVEIDLQFKSIINNKWFFGDSSFEAGYYVGGLYSKAGFTYSTTNPLTRFIATGRPDSSAGPLYIFARNWPGNNDPTVMILYSCKIYNSSEILVKDFVPCYEPITDEVGVCEKVNKEFYGNIGTGTFIKGNKINPKVKLVE